MTIADGTITVILVAAAYLAVALGRFPGLRLDRVGATLLGAILLVVTGELDIHAAWAAVGVGTLALLFGLMVLSGSFVLSGFYHRVATLLAGLDASPPLLLALFILGSAPLSILLNHDVVIVAMTPVLAQVTLARGLNPLPFMLGFCFASNIAAAASLIGSPSNMILAERLGLSFANVAGFAGVPALASLPIVWVVIAAFYRTRWRLASAQPKSSPLQAIPFDGTATTKSALVTALVLLALLLTSVPPRIIALAGAAAILVSRRYASNDLLRQTDGSLLLLVFSLFIINAAFEATGLPAAAVAALREVGLDLAHPVALLLSAAVLSDIIGNSASVMLLIPHVGNLDRDLAGAALALGTGFSGSAVVFGSLAGIVVTEQAAQHGITIPFAEFSRTGIPIALVSLAIAAVWILWLT